MHHTLPGGAKQVEGDKKPAHHGKHRKVKSVRFDKAKKGGTMTVEHQNPTGEYPNPHGDETHVFTGEHDDFHKNIVPKLSKAMGVGEGGDDDGDEN